ncbi:SLC13 family permease [Thioclava sp. L04-15]|uniref:SLC13 family permease n=1 Tax=Thioclava sp. L04-15 TaxID=1915318 RepID=UPI00099666E2|nr:SLC13 family permease [Thioclava sp. L04-15]OOY26946.1 SLC13 family permease [Thioclava sp. L04-15]TNE83024.1 MAG: SLC13 family permease [Paracoccaceae bacterium]
MTFELASVLVLLIISLALFVLGKPRMDVVAVLLVIAMPFTGLISVSEALKGFSDPSVILIAALFVVGEALVRTGVTQWIGDQLSLRSGGSEAKMLVLLMLFAAGLSAFMSSTGVVAIFIPIVLSAARKVHIPPNRLMMSLSIAALISGMLTLVATPPNMVLNAELIRQGYDGFGFFDFSLFGVPVLVFAILYMLFMRRFLGPGKQASTSASLRPRFRDLLERFGLADRIARIAIPAASNITGHRLDELGLFGRDGVAIFALERRRRHGREFLLPQAHEQIVANDRLIVILSSPSFDLDGYIALHDLQRCASFENSTPLPNRDVGLVEAMVPPNSPLVGKSPVEANLRTISELSVLGICRSQQPVTGDVANTQLKAGDTLLLSGPWRTIQRLQEHRRDLVLLELPEEAEEYVPERKRAKTAIAVLAAMVLAMTFGVLPNAQIALITCIALGVFGCIDLPSAYRAINWQTLVLIAGMIPFALALERAGGVDLAAATVLDTFGESAPRVVLGTLFLVTMTLSLFMSNTATAVLMGPIALAIAKGMDASPEPFMMCVALAASTAFMTPVASPVNLLVLSPGGYRFVDFLKIGTPLALFTLLVAVGLLPIVYDF